MRHTSNVILDPDALAFNIAFLQKEMGEDILISSVVKGNAYGHGIETFVPIAESCGIRHFSVFSYSEAQRVQRSLQQQLPVMVMGHLPEADLAQAIHDELEFFVFDLRRLEAAVQIARDLGKKALIHIELETGMNRTGFSKAILLAQVVPFLLEHKAHYVLKGICTHFAGAESIANYVRIEAQKQSFTHLRSEFLKAGLHPEYTHTCCSAAAITQKEMRYNMVRIGILQYGLWPSPEIKIELLRQKRLSVFQLHRVLSWESQLLVIKDVKMGEFIGYGNNYQAGEDMRIGVVPVGYADGYSRMLSNSGTVLIAGVRAAVLGNVNMNSIVIDLRNIPEAAVGDRVVLIGMDGDNEISVASFGELSNQLNYELLSRLSMDIPRIKAQAD
ncbi:MAG: alanine racemase [Taibaiella sp.]|nr:alanine racemase [Taibaiella sp.]